MTSVALGIAVDQGLISGVDVPALSFFQAYDPDMSDPRRAGMTLEDLLTMRSGIDWNEMTSYDDASNSCNQMEASEAWIDFVLDHPMREDPGTVWDYNSGASVLLGRVGSGWTCGQRRGSSVPSALTNTSGRRHRMGKWTQREVSTCPPTIWLGSGISF